MADTFDPYYVWLGIPQQERPANFYRLLAIQLLESDPDVIDNAADQRTAHLRTFQSGKHGKEAEKLLNEVSAARVTLLDPQKKSAYDQRIKAWLAAQKAQAAGTPAPAAQQPAAPRPAENWDELIGDAGGKPLKPAGKLSSGGAHGKKRGAPVALFAVAGVLLAAAIGIGLFVLNSKPADGALAFDWPTDERADAKLTVDEKPVTLPASGVIPISAGEHRVSAERSPLYMPWTATIVVAPAEQHPVVIEWKPKAEVDLDWPAKDRAGAELTVDGKQQALSNREPLQLLMEPGQHLLRILRPGAEPVQTGVYVALGGRRTIAIAPTAAVGKLVVQWPAEQRNDSHLSIDGSDATPAASSEATVEFALPTGPHTVRITRRGFQPFEQSVELAAGDNKPLLLVWTPEVAAPNPQPVATPAEVTPAAPSPELPKVVDVAPAKKLPVPTADEQAKLAKQLDELYKPTHSAADSAKANELYDLAEKAQSPAERYMLLTKGAELAAGAGDLALAFGGVDQLAAAFEVEPFADKQKVLEKAVAAATTADQLTALVTAAEPLLDEAIAADQYGPAMTIAATASKALAKRPLEMQFRKAADDLLARRRRDIRMLEPVWATAQKAQKALELSPDDAEANSTLGRWYCLDKFDWPRGLPFLAKGKDDKLKSTALAELKPPATTDEQVQTADAWWDASPKELGLARDAIRLHAGDLYTAALPGLSSQLARIKIDKRLAEVAKLPRPAAPVPATVPITIVKARWGGGQNWSIVTPRVQEAVRRGETVWASADFLKADPTPGWRKHLEITFVKLGRQQTVELDEGRQWTKADYAGASRATAVSSAPPAAMPATAFALGQWVDALKLVDPDRDAVRGNWSRSGGEISCQPAPWARIVLPVTSDGSYDLEFEFTRTQGKSDVGAIFTVGSHQCLFLMDSYHGSDRSVSGLNRFDNKSIVDPGNPITRRPGTLENDHRYRALIGVRKLSDNRASVDVSLDGTPYLPHWEGDPALLSLSPSATLPSRDQLGLTVHQSTVTFHTVRLRIISGTAAAVAATADSAIPPLDVGTAPTGPADAAAAIPLGQWINLLKLVDPTRDAVNGQWSRSGAELVAVGTGINQLKLPVVPEGGYDLETEFTRDSGSSQDVNLLFPVGTRHCLAITSGFRDEGGISGLDLIGGRYADSPENPTLTRSGPLELGHRYRMLLSVRLLDEAQASIDEVLDGKPLLPHWSGRVASLSARGDWTLPDPRQPGLGTLGGHVTYHSVRLRPISGRATLVSSPAPAAAPSEEAAVLQFVEWMSPSDDKGAKNVFRKEEAGWVEYKDDKAWTRYTETARTADYVELYDAGRHVWVRLSRTQSVWSRTKSNWIVAAHGAPSGGSAATVAPKK